MDRGRRARLSRAIVLLPFALALFLAGAAAAAAPVRPDDAAAPGGEFRLRVLTYNCGLVPFFTPQCGLRASAIGRAIAALSPDVAGLQEVWRRADAKAIAEAAGLPYQVHFFDGAWPSGLVIFSRHPIEAPALRVFPLNGLAHLVLLGHVDWYAAKGVATARLRTPLGPLPFLTTHLISPHHLPGVSRARFIGHRLAQVEEIAAALERARRPAPPDELLPAVVAGDLNAAPGSPEVNLLLALGGLRIAAAGGIDDIFTGEAPGFAVGAARVAREPNGTVLDAGGAPVALSDHDGVVADLVFRRTAEPPGPPPPPRNALAAGTAAGAILLTAAADASRDRLLAGAMAGAAIALLVFRHRSRRARRAAPRRGRLRRVAPGALTGALVLAAAGALFYALVAGPTEVATLHAAAARVERHAP